jgi:hypothetical protein
MDVRKCLLIAVCAMFAFTACRGQHASPDGRDHSHIDAALEETPPTREDAAGATYWGGQARQITLTDGTFTGPKGQRVELQRRHYAVGDLEGDGAVDTVVALAVTMAGAEDGLYIAVLRHLGTDTINLGTARLKNAVEVRGLRLEGRRIVVDLTRRETPDSAPVPATATYELGRGELIERSDSR